MSRYDEIMTMARENHHHLACTSPSRLSHHKALCYGAEWADKTMLDKACKWLEDSFSKLHDEYGNHLVFANSKDFIEKFKKAMMG